MCGLEIGKHVHKIASPIRLPVTYNGTAFYKSKQKGKTTAA